MSPILSSVGQSFAVATTFPKIVTNGLTLHLDAGQPNSYTTGTIWRDLSGRSSNATLINGPTYNTNNNGFFAFNGTTQYGTCSGTPLNVTSYTKSVWFRLTGTATNNNLISCSPGHFMFFGGTNKLYCGHSDWSGYQDYPSTTIFSTNTWYNACLTFNTTDGMTLYVNGVLDSTYTTRKTQAAGGGIEIASFAAGNLLTGHMAQALVYNRTLSAIEVLQNFNVLRSRFNI